MAIYCNINYTVPALLTHCSHAFTTEDICCLVEPYNVLECMQNFNPTYSQS